MLQRTLAKSVSVTGVGLHSGERVALTLHPAKENSGISFRRTDLSGEMGEVIKLNPYLINDTRLSSTIVTDKGVRIGTIEHIMSALSAYGIDNALIELNAPEIPIMDGSSLPFIYLLQDAGVVDQKAQKRFLKILKPVEIKETNQGTAFAPLLTPAPAAGSLKVSFMALGVWYLLADSGDGVLRDEAGKAVGTVSSTTGSVVLNLPVLPDVGSRLVFQWGGISGFAPPEGGRTGGGGATGGVPPLGEELARLRG